MYLWLKHVAAVSCYISQTCINGYYWRFVGSEMWDYKSPVAWHSMELNRAEQTKKPLHFLIKIISRVGCFCNLFICHPHPVVSCPTGAAVRTDGWHFLLAWQCSGLVFILFNINHHVFYVCIKTKFTTYHLSDESVLKGQKPKKAENHQTNMQRYQRDGYWHHAHISLRYIVSLYITSYQPPHFDQQRMPNIYIFFGLLSALLIVQLKIWQETGWERWRDTWQRAPRPGLEPRGHHSEDKASVHGTPALPTELN